LTVLIPSLLLHCTATSCFYDFSLLLICHLLQLQGVQGARHIDVRSHPRQVGVGQPVEVACRWHLPVRRRLSMLLLLFATKVQNTVHHNSQLLQPNHSRARQPFQATGVAGGVLHLPTIGPMYTSSTG
jgi:hypothetical protein